MRSEWFKGFLAPTLSIAPTQEAFESALKTGRRDQALEIAEEALVQAGDEESLRSVLKWLDRVAVGAPVAVSSNVARLKALVFNQLALHEDALACAEHSLRLTPMAVGARIEKSLALFELARFKPAAETLQSLLLDVPDEPWVWHALGLIAERSGDNTAAQLYFNRAATIAPDAFPLSIRMDEKEFDAVVKDAIADLPEIAARHMDKVVVSVEPFPSDKTLAGGGVSPTVLGLFSGVPVGERSLTSNSDHAPASIVLFQRNLERQAKTRAELIEQIAITLAHEVGHLLGLDEDELEERGLG